jgi:hypothetical protein
VPVLISETAIGPLGTESWQLGNLYAAIRYYGYLGLIWFDEDEGGELYRLEGYPQVIATFRQLTEPWRLIHQRNAKPGTS